MRKLHTFYYLPEAVSLIMDLRSKGITTDIKRKTKDEDLFFVVFVEAEKFIEAQEILHGNSQEEEDIPDHLLPLLDDELMEIIRDNHIYHEETLNAARLLLEERGIFLSDRDIELERTEAKLNLANGDHANPLWLLMGWILSMLGGILGVLIGYTLWSSKTVGPDGDKFNTYNAHARRQGKLMIIVGSLIFAGAIAYKLLKKLG